MTQRFSCRRLAELYLFEHKSDLILVDIVALSKVGSAKVIFLLG